MCILQLPCKVLRGLKFSSSSIFHSSCKDSPPADDMLIMTLASCWRLIRPLNTETTVLFSPRSVKLALHFVSSCDGYDDVIAMIICRGTAKLANS